MGCQGFDFLWREPDERVGGQFVVAAGESLVERVLQLYAADDALVPRRVRQYGSVREHIPAFAAERSELHGDCVTVTARKFSQHLLTVLNDGVIKEYGLVAKVYRFAKYHARPRAGLFAWPYSLC